MIESDRPGDHQLQRGDVRIGFGGIHETQLHQNVERAARLRRRCQTTRLSPQRDTDRDGRVDYHCYYHDHLDHR